VPDFRGRVAAGKDDMGGTAASRLTAGGAGINGATLGAAGGAQTHTLTTAQMPAHSHTVQTDSLGSGSYAGGAGYSPFVGGLSTGPAGSGAAHNNTQPTLITNKIIKT
jgi:microcystin-dependent protein